MYKKSYALLLILMMALVPLLIIIGCDDSGGDDYAEITDAVILTTGDVFNHIGQNTSTITDPDFSDPESFADYPEEVDVNYSAGPPKFLELTGTAPFDPDPSGESGILINSFHMTISLTEASPARLAFYYKATATGWSASSVETEGEFTWSGVFEDSPPDGVTGTLEIDGKNYDIVEVFEEVQKLWEEEDEKTLED